MWAIAVLCVCAEPPAVDRERPPPAPPPTDLASSLAPEDAEPPPPPDPDRPRRSPLVWQDLVAVRARRGVAEDFLVLPSGIDVGGRLRALTADGGFGPGRIRITDVALFDSSVEWAIARHHELDATITLLPKQPDTMHEHVVQGASLAVKRELARRTALSLSASVAPLLGLPGLAERGAVIATHDHALDEIVTFELSAGATATHLPHALLVEVTGHAAVLAREPSHTWGGWLGVGYAVPVAHRGDDPVGGTPLAPRPRLDLDLGNAVRLAEHWDLSAELAIIDRGDLADPATRLPVLDGGFDQIQLIVGVSRRFTRR